MRIWVLVPLLLAAAISAAAFDDPSIPELVARAEASELKDQPARFIDIAEKQLKAANRLYDETKYEEAQAAVEDVNTYSAKAADAAIQSGKRLKKTEIAIRKMASKLDDIKRTLPFDYHAPVQATIDKLEGLRTALLDRMFRKDKKKK